MKTFVTLGFERRPFDRLLRPIDEGVASHIIPSATLVQRGHSPYVLRRCPSIPFLSYAEMCAALNTSDIVIAHAGVGTLLHCLRLNKIPILFPRSAKLGEHVDDHQVVFARIMQEQKKALVVYEAGQLLDTFRDYHRLIADFSGSGNGDGRARLSGYLEKKLSEYLGKEPD